jgi:hypothetical protein
MGNSDRGAVAHPVNPPPATITKAEKSRSLDFIMLPFGDFVIPSLDGTIFGSLLLE